MCCVSTSKAAAVAVLASALLAGSGLVSALRAADDPITTGPACSSPAAKAAPAAKAQDIVLDEADEVAALSSVQIALSRMDDGTPFIWKRGNGRLSGMVRPTSSFRSSSGALCRHVIVLLTTGNRTRTAEGVACRLDGGRWKLEG